MLDWTKSGGLIMGVERAQHLYPDADIPVIQMSLGLLPETTISL